jgi:hypothetical protein
MSYKFPVFRCETCGVTRADPVDAQFAWPSSGPDVRIELDNQSYRCNIAYVIPEGFRACGGIMRPWAMVDSDSFITMTFGK